jgi:alpha-N-arabinofuranosidase
MEAHAASAIRFNPNGAEETFIVNRIIVNADQPGPKISRHIYGHFSEHLGRCIYEGMYVGENSPIPNTRGMRNDVVQALRDMKIPVLRWPGGCFADEYHWQDGIGPQNERPSIVNTHWGGVTEDNRFGTHEFMELVEQLGCEPYICGNVGSGTVQEMAQWVEYLTHDGGSPMSRLRAANGRSQPWRVSFWGVGNENWGCGGNMLAEHYANLVRQYGTYCRNFGGNKLFKIAGGFYPEYNETLLRIAGNNIDGLSIHHYVFPGDWGNKGSATEFDEKAWFLTLKKTLEVETAVRRTKGILDYYDPNGRIALLVDEWGTWFNCEPGTNPGFLYQQNTVRDALVAGTMLNMFNRHADRIRMANIAQIVNVLQAMILTEGEKMVLTPTYHVFHMYQVHHDADLLPSTVVCDDYANDGEKMPSINVSASRSNDRVNLTICNLNPNAKAEIVCDVRGLAAKSATARVLTGSAMQAHNTFAATDTVKPVAFEDMKLDGNILTIQMPAMSVVAVEIA